jgi:Protein of unknown function (DUF2911)
MKHALQILALAAPVAIPLASTSRAQADEAALEFPAASPPCLVRNQIGTTTVEIQYGRPGVKGRKVFGGLVPYGEVWRTGANSATRITFSGDVRFGGADVTAGTYALFTVPDKTSWTVILNKAADQWGSYGYDEKQDVTRVQVQPETLAKPVETMTLDLADLRDDSAHLVLTWETTRIEVPIKTDLVARMQPRIEAAMAAEGGQKPYLQAAMFYYEHDLDLYKAREWADAAEAAQPEAVWVVYRKGLILAKMGDKEGARESANRTAELAAKAGGSLGAEYGRLSKELNARLD